MRLPNGYGSVVKLSGNRRRPYVARKTKDRSSTGQTYDIIGYFETKEDALQALADSNRNAISMDQANITLEDLYTQWYAQQEDLVGDSSLEGYRTAWRHFAQLYNKRFRDIKKSHIQAIVDGLRGSYSKSAMTKVKMLMTMLMDYAMADDIVDKNYAKLVRIPRKEESKKESFTDAEVKRLFANDADPWIQSILILIYTGMRIAELLSLTKFNVDLKQNVIVGGLKTDAGKDRIIPIHKKILPYVKSLYEKSSGPLIELTGETIKLKTDNYRRKYYYPALQKAKIAKERHSPHACRYTFALMLERSGVTQLQAQKLLGHADYATTANVYTNPDTKMLREAINKIG